MSAEAYAGGFEKVTALAHTLLPQTDEKLVGSITGAKCRVMDAAKETLNAEQNAAGGIVEAGSSGGPSTLRTMDFAHQMRDLLTVVVGSLEQLRRQPLDEQGHHQLTRAETGIVRVIDLLNRYAPLSDPGRQDGHKAKEPQ